MKMSDLKKAIRFSLENNLNLLIKGVPGGGKTTAVNDIVDEMGMPIITTYPVVSDPTDFKGLPFPHKNGKGASFLPFGDLQRIIEAKEPTLFFMDDIGQATPATQAALMSLLLRGKVGEHKVSPYVRFMGATNRRSDKAGVRGMLEPVKSKFTSIVELDVDADEWIKWGRANNIPEIVLAYIKYTPDHLLIQKPTLDIVNSPNPRTWADVGKKLRLGLVPKFAKSMVVPMSDSYAIEMIAGSVGPDVATEFAAFTSLVSDMPTFEEVCNNPTKTSLPDNMSVMWAISAMLIKRVCSKTISKVITYIKRMPTEFQFYIFQGLNGSSPAVMETLPFVRWAREIGNMVGDK